MRAVVFSLVVVLLSVGAFANEDLAVSTLHRSGCAQRVNNYSPDLNNLMADERRSPRNPT
jgi:hypothetical protein